MNGGSYIERSDSGLGETIIKIRLVDRDLAGMSHSALDAILHGITLIELGLVRVARELVMETARRKSFGPFSDDQKLPTPEGVPLPWDRMAEVILGVGVPTSLMQCGASIETKQMWV